MPHHSAASSSATAAVQTRGRTIRRWARIYDPVAGAMAFGRLGAIRESTVRLAAIKPGERVLDAGCGTGALSFLVKARTPDALITGIDASPEMIDVATSRARKKGMEIAFPLAAIESLPFEEAAFDVVMASLMLHHLPDDVKREGLAEVVRVLRPGGRFIAVDFASGGRGLLGHVHSFLGRGHAHGHGDSHDLVEQVRSAGFATVETPRNRSTSLVFIRARKSEAPVAAVDMLALRS